MMQVVQANPCFGAWNSDLRTGNTALRVYTLRDTNDRGSEGLLDVLS